MNKQNAQAKEQKEKRKEQHDEQPEAKRMKAAEPSAEVEVPIMPQPETAAAPAALSV
jgi:hypothetical protein